MRHDLNRLLRPVQEEGPAPEARRRGPRGRDRVHDRAQRGLGRHGRGQHATAPRRQLFSNKTAPVPTTATVPMCNNAGAFSQYSAVLKRAITHLYRANRVQPACRVYELHDKSIIKFVGH